MMTRRVAWQFGLGRCSQ